MTRKHVYVSFTDRVSAIRIDPIRRSDGKRNAPTAVNTESFFISAIERWDELNLATHYTEFSSQCRPLAQSLAMVIYNRSKISELLIDSIETTDEHSAEPLLDLMVQFARDLGEDFEEFYPRSLQACINLIQKSQGDDESLGTVELAFNCLAHIFKYLSRLLTTNLIPTYNILKPLFGGQKGTKQRSYVLRFAAESMAFLVRRSNGEGLTSIVEHIVEGVSKDASNVQYMTSSSQLLAYALKGPQTSLHSKAPILIEEYYKACLKYNSVDLFGHILTDVLHHVRKDTALPVINTTLSCINSHHDSFSARCLFVLAGHRKGDRISNWPTMYDALIDVSRNVGDQLSLIQAASAIISYSDIFTTNKYLKSTLESLPSLRSLVSVIKAVKTLNGDVLSTLESIVWHEAVTKTKSSSDHDLELLALMRLDVGLPTSYDGIKALNSVGKEGLLSKVADKRSHYYLFSMWWRSALCQANNHFDKEGYLTSTFRLEAKNPAWKAVQAQTIAHLLEDTLPFDVRKLAELPFIPSLLEAVTNVLQHTSLERSSMLADWLPKLLSSLRRCDPKIRGAAIDLLDALVDHSEKLHSVLNECRLINWLPHDLENARNITQRLRSLATAHTLAGTNDDSDRLLAQIILNFVFGMLTTKLQPVWQGVLDLIPKLSEKDADGVCRIAMEFIENPSPEYDANSLLDDFEDDSWNDPSVSYQQMDCYSLETVQTVSERSLEESDNYSSTLKQRAVSSISFEHHNDIRTLGIKVLSKIPHAAEKRVSLKLVPYLLEAHDDEDTVENGEKSLAFTFQDKLLLLELFAKFKRMDKVPDFDKLHQKYLYFLGSRHAPLQQLGLKCLLAVSGGASDVLRRYQEHLEALLDDKRFRDEVTGFICAGEDQMTEESLHPDDREAMMPYVLRILYGRAQNGTKRNMRYSVLSSLHFLKPADLLAFVDLAHAHLKESGITRTDISLGDRVVQRKLTGYLSFISDLAGYLKSAVKPCIPSIFNSGIKPILLKLDVHEDKAVRQLVTKNLESLLASVPTLATWESYYPVIYERLIHPQLEGFAAKNRETESTLMRLLLEISRENELAGLIDKAIVEAACSCLSNGDVKDTILVFVLRFVINLIQNVPALPTTRLSVVQLVQRLPAQLETERSIESLALAVESINKMFQLGIDEFDAETIHNIALVAFEALQKPSRLVPLHVKGSILEALSRVLSNPNTSLTLINEAYFKLGPLFKQFVSHDHRLHLSACYEVFGRRNPELSRVGTLINELNSFSQERLGEPDFTRRSAAFEKINEELWRELSEEEWRPIMFNMLFFMRDPEELALRNNGKFSVMRLIESSNAPHLVADVVLPAIKRGLRDEDEKFRRLYIDLLGQCAKDEVMPTLSVLLYNGDEEADFFININHVQLHRRRRAFQRLSKNAGLLDENLIAHYLLSIVENVASAYSGSKNGEMNNLADDALHCMTELLKHISSGQYKSVARRWVQNVLKRPEPAILRKNTRVLISVAQASPRGIDEFLLKNIIPPLQRFLSSKSNEHENLPDRIPIAVAIVHFMNSLEKEALESQLPGKLTPLCQLLKSKIPEMRDTVRQTLGRITRILGPRYLKFIVSELYYTLHRGGLQSHVLGFTIHSLLVELNRSKELQVGDLDDSASIIGKVVMDDTFGATGEEKDEEYYSSSAKEVKKYKSYDTAELLSCWTSLSHFGRLIEPLRLFLSSTKLSSKAEHKVEEVLRRMSTGLHKNAQAGTEDAVVLGFEIFSSCDKVLTRKNGIASNENSLSGSLKARMQAAKESEEFFTVRLSSRDWYRTDDSAWPTGESKVNRYASTNLHLLETFALDMLRGVMTSTSGGGTTDSGRGLLTVSNVKGLLPIIVKGLESTHEDVNIAALRLATTALRLPVPFSNEDNTLEVCGDRSLHFIESSPNTNSLICQSSLKFLTMLIRSKPEFEIKGGAVAFILEKIRPDLEEPERQGAVISFIRAIFARKVMLPQVYDIADTIAKVLVTNPSDHIRINCRAAYLHFLTVYPLGKTRLDRHLADLGANLRYESSAGRLSVMAMIESLLDKISADQLEATLTQYFASLVLLLVTDTEPQCRQKALQLVERLVDKAASTAAYESMAEYCENWLGSLGKNDLLVRGGLEVAKFFLNNSENSKLEKKLHTALSEILRAGQRGSQGVEWQLVYVSLNNNVLNMINLVEGILLYPHPWVRARASRVVGQYFKETVKSELDIGLLSRIGYKMVRQLAAPRLTSSDSLQIVKNLTFILPIWESCDAKMGLIYKNSSDENREHVNDEQSCLEWVVNKLASMIRTEVSAADYKGSKTGALQLLATLPGILKETSTQKFAYDAILSLYLLNDQLATENAHPDLQELAQEALNIFEEALGTTAYLKRYSEAQQFVQARRRDRRAKRAVEAVANPEAYAIKKIKRNAHKHEVKKSKKRKAI